MDWLGFVRSGRVIAILAFAALLAPALAFAQVPSSPAAATVDVTVESAQLTVSLDAGATTDVFVTNTGEPNPIPQLNAPRRVNLEVTGVPDGWTVSISPNTFRLSADQTGTAVLSVSVTAAARDKVANINVTARIYPLGLDPVPGAGPAIDPEAQDSAGVTAARQDSINRQVTEQVGPYIFLLLGALAVAVIAIVALLLLRGRAAVRIAADEGEMIATPGAMVTFALRVANLSGREDSVALRFAVPPEWRAQFSDSQIDLAARQEAGVGLDVHVPKGAGPQRYEVVVTGISSLPRKASTVRLVVHVQLPEETLGKRRK